MDTRFTKKYTYRQLYKQNASLKEQLDNYKIAFSKMKPNQDFLNELYSEIFESRYAGFDCSKRKSMLIDMDL